MTEQVEQGVCIKFCFKLEHSSMETILVIQKAAAMGNWWSAASSRQYASSRITSCAVFWQNIKSPRWVRVPYSPDLAPWDFWLFPKLKPLKGKKFQTIIEIQDNMMGQLMTIGRIVWVPKVATLTWTEASLSYVQCFLYLVSPINVSIFHITWLGTFWTDSVFIIISQMTSWEKISRHLQLTKD